MPQWCNSGTYIMGIDNYFMILLNMINSISDIILRPEILCIGHKPYRRVWCYFFFLLNSYSINPITKSYTSRSMTLLSLTREVSGCNRWWFTQCPNSSGCKKEITDDQPQMKHTYCTHSSQRSVTITEEGSRKKIKLLLDVADD